MYQYVFVCLVVCLVVYLPAISAFSPSLIEKPSRLYLSFSLKPSQLPVTTAAFTTCTTFKITNIVTKSQYLLSLHTRSTNGWHGFCDTRLSFLFTRRLGMSEGLSLVKMRFLPPKSVLLWRMFERVFSAQYLGRKLHLREEERLAGDKIVEEKLRICKIISPHKGFF